MYAWRRGLTLSLLVFLGTSGCRDTHRLVQLSEEEEAAEATDAGTPVAEGVPMPTQGQPAPVPAEQPGLEELDSTPTPTPDGVPGPMGDVYVDKGPADPGARIRGLISFPIRNVEELEDRLRRMYDPGRPEFRRYLSAEEWISRHAPAEEDVRVVKAWLESEGLQVPRVATNRLLLQFTGTVARFNEAFGAALRVLERESPQAGNAPHDVYGLTGDITAPRFVRDRIDAVVTADLAVPEGMLPGELGTPPEQPPVNLQDALTPEQVAHAYNVDALYAEGFRGKGVKLGVTIGAHFRFKDLRAFWKAFGVERADPEVVQTMEPPVTRYREGTLDVQWSGVMAPEADLVVYMGPDARNTSMVYTYNEAIAQGRVSVITDSFAHREDSEPRAVSRAYAASSMMAAALGITVVAASGDSAGVDTPSNNPYVTGVGGTRLRMNGHAVESEVTWWYSGSGLSRHFPIPEWQRALPHLDGSRAVADVALNAESPYWYLFLGQFTPSTGTSFASPVFAGLLAVVNGARASEGKPAVGWLNPVMYTTPAVQASFRDITVGMTDRGYQAGPGWDVPTGWGAPDARGLLDSLP